MTNSHLWTVRQYLAIAGLEPADLGPLDPVTADALALDCREEMTLAHTKGRDLNVLSLGEAFMLVCGVA